MGNGVATLKYLSKQVSWPEKTPKKAFFGQDICLPLFSTGSEAKHARPQGGRVLSWLKVGALGKTSFWVRAVPARLCQRPKAGVGAGKV